MIWLAETGERRAKLTPPQPAEVLTMLKEGRKSATEVARLFLGPPGHGQPPRRACPKQGLGQSSLGGQFRAGAAMTPS